MYSLTLLIIVHLFSMQIVFTECVLYSDVYEVCAI